MEAGAALTSVLGWSPTSRAHSTLRAHVTKNYQEFIGLRVIRAGNESTVT
jgi:hypothetical protein